MNRPRRPTATTVLAVVTFVGAAVLFAVHRTADPDLPWHLRTGQLAVELRSTLPADPFSYSFPGAPWRYKDLLADVVLYLGSAALGAAWMPVLQLCVALAYPLCLRYALPREDRHPVLLVLASLSALCGFGMAERPQIFAHLAFLALLAALDRAHRKLALDVGGRAAIAALAPVVLIEWSWVWLHRSALIGLALGLAFPLRLAASTLATRGDRWRAVLGPAVPRRAIGAASTAGVVALGLAFLNPSGAAFFSTSLAVARSKLFRLVVSDFMPLGLDGYFRGDPLGASLVTLALVAGAARLAWALRRPPRPDATPSLQLWHVLVLAGFVGLLWDAARWMQFAALTASVVQLHLGSEALRILRARGARLPRGAGALVVLAMVVAAVVHRRGLGDLAIGDDLRVRPAGAIAFAREHGLGGEVVAPLYYGGYLLAHAWPEARVMIDGRNEEVYPIPFVVRAVVSDNDPRVFAEMRREDGATWVVASNLPGHASHRFLAQDPDWMMVYWSDAAVIYALRSAHPELQPWSFEAVRDPYAVIVEVRRVMLGGGDRDRLQQELARMLHESPQSVRAGAALCMYLHLSGPSQWGRRDEVLRDLVALAPEHPLVTALQAEIGAAAR